MNKVHIIKNLINPTFLCNDKKVNIKKTQPFELLSRILITESNDYCIIIPLAETFTSVDENLNYTDEFYMCEDCLMLDKHKIRV